MGVVPPDRPRSSSSPSPNSLGPPVSSPQLQRRHGTAGPERPLSQDSNVHPQIPNPVICLVEGDVILFQLLILPHSESAHWALLPVQALTHPLPGCPVRSHTVPSLCSPPHGSLPLGLNFTFRGAHAPALTFRELSLQSTGVSDLCA